MNSITFRNVTVLTEKHSLCELLGVLDKNVPFCFSGKEIKGILIKNTIFRFLGTINKLFVNFPTDWTHISVLTE